MIKNQPKRPFYYGGQAVIEGVMIRGAHHMSVAVRRPDGQIALKVEQLSSALGVKLRRIPLLRGVIVLWETLALGTRALVFSSQAAVGDEEEIDPFAIWLSLGAAMIVALAVFFAGPALLTGWLESLFGNHLAAVLAEGVLRLALVVGYIFAIGFLPDIRRVFAYHGAEHKAIHALEAGMPLTPIVVQQYSTAHARCGTAFLLTVAIVSVIVFAMLGSHDLVPRLLSRIVLVPVIAGISYEVIRLSAANQSNPLGYILAWPGLMLQRLTTREPDDSQVEVAIYALKQVLAADGVPLVADEPDAHSQPLPQP